MTIFYIIIPCKALHWSEHISPAEVVRKVGGWRVCAESNTIESISLIIFHVFLLFCQFISLICHCICQYQVRVYFPRCSSEKSGRVECVCRIRYYWKPGEMTRPLTMLLQPLIALKTHKVPPFSVCEVQHEKQVCCIKQFK